MSTLDKLEQALRGNVPDKVADEIIEKLKPFVIELEEHDQLVSALENDFNCVLKELMGNRDDQLRRRTLVRTLFAAVEGTVFAIKRKTLAEHKIGGCELSPAEYAMLVEEAYDLRDNGHLRTSQKFIRLQANIRFAFSIYTDKVGRISFCLDTNDSGWTDFLQAIEIRNRLMHPKALKDLEVTDSELDCVLSAAKWFNDQVGRLMTAVKEGIKQSANKQFQETLMAHAKRLIEERLASQRGEQSRPT